MKQIIVTLIIISSLLVGCTLGQAQAYSVSYNNIIYTYNELPILEVLIEEQEQTKEAAHKMAEAARQLGYDEEHEVIILAKKEYEEADSLIKDYQELYSDLVAHWEIKENEYPYAAYIWKYFKDLGYNSYVCAGILGNMMSECGGGTLALQPTIYSSGGTYYGICQWSKAYTGVRGASLEEQCNFLRDTIEYELNTYGSNYKKDFDYNDFLALTDAEEAALAFSKCYERCNSSSYKARKKNAITAYNYFVS